MFFAKNVSLLISLSGFLLVSCEIPKQNTGVLMYGDPSTRKTSIITCQCYQSDTSTDNPAVLKNIYARKFMYACEIKTRRSSLVVLEVRSSNSSRFSMNLNCTIRKVDEMLTEFWTSPNRLSENLSGQCLFITNLIVSESTSFARVFFYCLLVSFLVMGAVFATNKFGLVTRLRERWRARQDYSLPPYVNFRL